MRKSKVTIRDVAKAAGVHISTASRALNSETQRLITADVVERVRSVARKLDYRANAFASGLRTKRSNAIGLLIPDLWNPAFPAIVAGVQEVVVREGYEITIASDENSSERHATVIESMLSRQVDGLILATAILKDRAITELASRTYRGHGELARRARSDFIRHQRRRARDSACRRASCLPWTPGYLPYRRAPEPLDRSYPVTWIREGDEGSRSQGT